MTSMRSDGVSDRERHTQIAAAARLLRAGGVVAFPTETVYGLGADAANPEAVRKIFEIKGRPSDHPLIVHIADASLLDRWAREIPQAARHLAESFWPSPLTLILRRQRHVPDAVTGGQDTVGLRVPDHPVALALLQELGPEKALAAPSANRFGRISPTTAAHVRAELDEAVDMVLDGGPCRVGLESTIISFVGGTPLLLRPGGISVAALEAVLGGRIEAPDTAQSAVRVSGSLPSHYAPVTPLEVLSAESLKRRSRELVKREQRVAVLGLTSPCQDSPHLLHFQMPAAAAAYAHKLYATLRQLDGVRFDFILAEAPPVDVDWQAVNDRLRRAAIVYCPAEIQPQEKMYEEIS
ncbi:L-threonylcarbamoyladenylate synthase [Sulfuricella sp.]|uniref:L-threonylcarbamoyladenylate synthase n=1 Tax=Sulfuricella sp. TaxID=2099377 RepID=UPI002C36C4C6|nr:L-threonylcarbamoyladenylate synthase [Sulfuricella sp.]HUX64984.1 L-threonylcarbamoyladenylate synthase [Sulfuricella sp.]